MVLILQFITTHFNRLIIKRMMVSFYVFHLLPEQRQLLHQQCVDALVSNGTLMLIGFSKEQLPLNSGGPKNIEMLFSKDDIRSDFHLLTQHSLNQYSANLDEGDFHQGLAEMVGFIGQKQ